MTAKSHSRQNHLEETTRTHITHPASIWDQVAMQHGEHCVTLVGNPCREEDATDGITLLRTLKKEGQRP